MSRHNRERRKNKAGRKPRTIRFSGDAYYAGAFDPKPRRRRIWYKNYDPAKEPAEPEYVQNGDGGGTKTASQLVAEHLYRTDPEGRFS